MINGGEECRCGREAMTVFLVLIPRMDKRINRTDLCMHARSPFLIPSFLDLCTLLLCSCSGCCLFELVFMYSSAFMLIFIHYADLLVDLVHGSRRITQCL